MFLDLMDSRGEGGTPGKRVPEDFINKVVVLIFTINTEFVLYFWIRVGDPYKRVPEGFFDKVCVLIFAS